MTTLIRVNCARCGSFNSVPVIRTPDFETNLPGEFEVARCKDCNFEYTSVRPIAEELFTKFYPDDYLCYGKKTGSRIADFIDMLRTSGQVKQRVRYLTKNFRINSCMRILEIGCATGKFLKYCTKRFGFEVYGIEPNKRLCEILGEENINVINSTFEDAQLPENYYDIICLFHVIEHLWDAIYTIKRLNSLLKINGILFMELPNNNTPGKKFFGKYWFNYHQPRHLTHFDLKTLKEVAKECGFIIKNHKYEFRPTINAFSIQYAIGDKTKHPSMRKFFTTKNPMLILLGIWLELFFGVLGRPSTMSVIMKKKSEISKPLKSLMQEISVTHEI